MKLRRKYVFPAIALCPAAIGVIAYAAATDEQKCLASKLKAVGKLEACLFKSYALQVLKGLPSPDFTKCSGKFTSDSTNIESRYAGACPTMGDASAVADIADDHAADMYDLLNGPESDCGDGTREGDEACDGIDLGGSSCSSVAPATPNGTLACTPGCEFDTSGCLP